MTNQTEDAVIGALQEAIENRQSQIDHLEKEIRQLIKEFKKRQREVSRGKRRRSSGLRRTGVAFYVEQILRDKGRSLSNAELVVELKNRGKDAVTNRSVAATLHRYVKKGKFFDQDNEGKYSLKK